MGPRGMAVVGILSLALTRPGSAAAQTKPPSQGFSENVHVDVRTVLAIVTDGKGKPLTTPVSPADIAVLEDGAPAKVLGVDSVGSGGSDRSAVPAATVSAASAPPAPALIPSIPQILYVDTSLLQARGMKRVADALEKNLAAILSRGPLEVVVADPDPTIALESTTDAPRVAAWLADASRKITGRARLSQVRRDHLQARNNETRTTPNTQERLSRIRDSTQEEIRIVEQSLESLEKWTAGGFVHPPAVLYLANDGFDMNPVEFYSNLSDPFLGGVSNDEQRQLQQLRTEFAPAIPRLVARLADTLSNEGVMTVVLATGGSEASFAADAASMGKLSASDQHSALAATATLLFVRPLEPLRQIAQETGGEVVTQENSFSVALDRLAHAVVITYRMERPPDGRPHRLEVRSLRAGVVVRAASSVVAGSGRLVEAAQSAVEALATPPAAGALPIEMSVDLLEVKNDGRRGGELHVTADLGSILEALDRVGPGRIRVTVAVQSEGKQPFVHHEEVDLDREGPGARWLYDAPIEWPPEAARIAVTVEELKTGARGTSVAQLPKELEPR